MLQHITMHPRSLSAVLLFLLLVPTAYTAEAQGFTYHFLRGQPNIPGVRFGSVTQADHDGDGDYDVLVTGATQTGTGLAKIFPFLRYDFVPVGQSGLTEVALIDSLYPPLPTQDAWYSASAWADADLDGELDLALAGGTSPVPPHDAGTHLYLNDGGGFSAADVALPGLLSGSVTWADYDNDGDPDLLLTGVTGPEGTEPFTALYDNDAGHLTASAANLPPLAHSTAAWADLDVDGDLDVVLSGLNLQGKAVTVLYRNDGASFTATGTGLPGLLFPTASWGDYDDDGDPDLLLTGARPAPALYRGVARIYRNDGGTLVDSSTELPDAFFGGGSWGDYDNDGRLDFVLMGQATMQGTERVGRFYRNTGTGFAHATNVPGIFLGALAWGDLDGDYDLDLIVSGEASSSLLTRLYRNESTRVNQRPAAPSGLRAETSGGDVTLQWDPTSDPETATSALTYNLRVGTSPGASDVMSAEALPSGRRLLPARGNAEQNMSWTLHGLPDGTYYWSVQALDHSFVGSSFADEATFTITDSGKRGTGAGTDATLPDHLALHPAYPNPFARHTTLRFDLPAPAPVALRVYDVLGRTVRTLASGAQPAGTVALRWDGRDGAGHRLAPGLYVVRLETGDGIQVQTVVLAD